jgi:hypothetical protein
MNVSSKLQASSSKKKRARKRCLARRIRETRGETHCVTDAGIAHQNPGNTETEWLEKALLRKNQKNTNH